MGDPSLRYVIAGGALGLLIALLTDPRWGTIVALICSGLGAGSLAWHFLSWRRARRSRSRRHSPDR